MSSCQKELRVHKKPQKTSKKVFHFNSDPRQFMNSFPEVNKMKTFLRIVLTWSILLYHTVQIYLPQIGFFVGIHSENSDGWIMAGVGFIISMNVWNMPMFFLLSGIRDSEHK